ncbi:MAG: PadR family transcriptional regulator [Anaerolineales bacterium]|nr:PadR family transcriptional regulator [Anaerolineales bacterium]
MYDMTMDTSQLEAYEKIVLEMRRGILIMAVLSQLQSEKYGYALITDLEAHGLPIDQGTLYPLLRRLEGQGLLDSSWNTDGARPRRYYVINASGRLVLAELQKEWQALAATLDVLLTHGDKS